MRTWTDWRNIGGAGVLPDPPCLQEQLPGGVVSGVSGADSALLFYKTRVHTWPSHSVVTIALSVWLCTLEHSFRLRHQNSRFPQAYFCSIPWGNTHRRGLLISNTIFTFEAIYYKTDTNTNKLKGKYRHNIENNQ